LASMVLTWNSMGIAVKFGINTTLVELEMGNFTWLGKFFPFPMQHSRHLSQISLLPMLLHKHITWEKNQRNKWLMTKEALVGENNLKLLLAVHKRSIDWKSLLGNKPKVQLYDILVINTHSQLCFGFVL